MYPGGGNSGGFGYPPDTSGYPPLSQQPGGFNVAPGKEKFSCLLTSLYCTFGNKQIRNRAYF